MWRRLCGERSSETANFSWRLGTWDKGRVLRHLFGPPSVPIW